MILTAVPFDTLKFARHLEASGFAPAAAAGAAEALADAMTGANLATKADIGETNREIGVVRSDLTLATAALRTELKAEIASLRTELKAAIGSVRTELKGDIELLRRDITIKFGSMLVLAVGILLTAIRYLPPHP